jgi:hypothetical protein
MKQVFLVLLVVVLGCVQDSEELSPQAPSTCAPCPTRVGRPLGKAVIIQDKVTCECVIRPCAIPRCQRGYSLVKCKDSPCDCCGLRPTVAPPAPVTCAPCPADKFGSIYYIQNKDTCECVQRNCIRYRCAAQSTSVKCKDTPCLCCGPRRTTSQKPKTCAPCPANVFNRSYYIQNKDTCKCEQRFCIKYRCAAQSTVLTDHATVACLVHQHQPLVLHVQQTSLTDPTTSRTRTLVNVSKSSARR